MNLLFAGCGLLFGFIAGVGVHALTSYKEKEAMQEEIDNLKKEVAFNKKMRQSVH
ncbi:MAG: hypothetical protein MJ246_05710 [Clostridia bacterium]|nr:hypothetical protein [Clostridia bacterium]